LTSTVSSAEPEKLGEQEVIANLTLEVKRMKIAVVYFNRDPTKHG
jgi:hypothetical protein